MVQVKVVNGTSSSPQVVTDSTIEQARGQIILKGCRSAAGIKMMPELAIDGSIDGGVPGILIRNDRGLRQGFPSRLQAGSEPLFLGLGKHFTIDPRKRLQRIRALRFEGLQNHGIPGRSLGAQFLTGSPGGRVAIGLLPNGQLLLQALHPGLFVGLAQDFPGAKDRVAFRQP